MCIKWIQSWFKREESKSNTSRYCPQGSVDIQAFVQAAIVGIMSGIRGAQKEYTNGNSAFDPLICPAWGPPLSDLHGGTKGYADKIFELEFDLAITVAETSSSSASGKAGVAVMGVYEGNIGCTADSSGSQSTISRLRFKVPVRYPLAELGPANWNPQKIVGH